MIISIDEKMETIENLQKQGYRLIQSKKGYRFGEDTVLLADFIARYVKGLLRISKCVDLGANAGASTLLLHARCPDYDITSFEIQSAPFKLLTRNIELNHLSEKIKPINEDIRNIQKNKLIQGSSFDLVYTNPPYFSPQRGLLSPKKDAEEKTNSRFEINGTLTDFVKAAAYALRPGGIFAIVCRVSRLTEVFDMMKEKNIEPTCIRFVHPTVDKQAQLFLLAGRKGSCTGGLTVLSPLILRDPDGQLSKEYVNIYGETKE